MRNFFSMGAFLRLLLILILLAGCAENRSSDSTERRLREAYAKRLALVGPGMTRRELYAVLPPANKPQAYPPMLVGYVSVAMYTSHHEIHFLDSQHYIEVLYQLASIRDYPTSDIYPRDTQKHGLTHIKPGSSKVPSVENPKDIITKISDVKETGTNGHEVDNFSFQRWGSIFDVTQIKGVPVNISEFVKERLNH